jgi:hypothetical protein
MPSIVVPGVSRPGAAKAFPAGIGTPSGPGGPGLGGAGAPAPALGQRAQPSPAAAIVSTSATRFEARPEAGGEVDRALGNGTVTDSDRQ